MNNMGQYNWKGQLKANETVSFGEYKHLISISDSFVYNLNTTLNTLATHIEFLKKTPLTQDIRQFIEKNKTIMANVYNPTSMSNTIETLYYEYISLFQQVISNCSEILIEERNQDCDSLLQNINILKQEKKTIESIVLTLQGELEQKNTNVKNLEADKEGYKELVQSKDNLEKSYQDLQEQYTQYKNVHTENIQLQEQFELLQQTVVDQKQLQSKLKEALERIKELESPEIYKLDVPGNTLWTPTELLIEDNNIVSIEAQGEILYDSEGNSCTAEGTGWSDERDQKDPLYTKPHAGLIGKINDTGKPFFIGESSRFRVKSGGKLYLGINDAWIDGNIGDFHATIQVEKEEV